MNYFLGPDGNNTVWNNNFENNVINAHEGPFGNNYNNWNYSGIGNCWDDFENNSGYPNNYVIDGPGNGVDYLPNTCIKCNSFLYKDTKLTGDVVGCYQYGLILEFATSISLDCDGYRILGRFGGGPTYGVFIANSNDINITNCNIERFNYGIYLENTFNNRINNNNITDAWNTGIYFKESYDNILSNNFIQTPIRRGINLESNSNNNIFNNNIIKDNNRGIEINNQCTNNQFTENIFDNNAINAYEISDENIWDVNGIGNYWHNIFNNLGWPDRYIVDGPGDGVDNFPLEEWVDLKTIEFDKANPDNPKIDENIIFYFKIFNNANKELENVDYIIETGDGRTIYNDNLLDIPKNTSKLVYRFWNYSNPGLYFPRIIIDHEDLIEEFDESNNNFVLVLNINDVLKEESRDKDKKFKENK